MTDLPERWKWQEISTAAPVPTAEWLTARIEACLSLYYQPAVSEAVDVLALTSWLDVLGGIPQAAIEQAFGDWERNETHRPTPAHIRARALARLAKAPKHMPAERQSCDVLAPERAQAIADELNMGEWWQNWKRRNTA